MVTMTREVKIVVQCNGQRKSGERCNHVVARVPRDDWEQELRSGIEFECKSCGKVATLANFL